jgi:nicotinamidase-related amidase
MHSAVLLIDMQPKYLQLLSYQQQRALEREQLHVLDYCTHRDVPVALIEYNASGTTLPRLLGAVRAVPRKGFYEKWQPDAFSVQGLERQLNEWDCNRVFLMGVFASQCIRTTALSAAQLGFTVGTQPSVIAEQPPEDLTDILDEFSQWHYCVQPYQKFLE